MNPFPTCWMFRLFFRSQEKWLFQFKSYSSLCYSMEKIWHYINFIHKIFFFVFISSRRKSLEAVDFHEKWNLILNEFIWGGKSEINLIPSRSFTCVSDRMATFRGVKAVKLEFLVPLDTFIISCISWQLLSIVNPSEIEKGLDCYRITLMTTSLTCIKFAQ